MWRTNLQGVQWNTIRLPETRLICHNQLFTVAHWNKLSNENKAGLLSLGAFSHGEAWQSIVPFFFVRFLLEFAWREGSGEELDENGCDRGGVRGVIDPPIQTRHRFSKTNVYLQTPTDDSLHYFCNSQPSSTLSQLKLHGRQAARSCFPATNSGVSYEAKLCYSRIYCNRRLHPF